VGSPCQRAVKALVRIQKVRVHDVGQSGFRFHQYMDVGKLGIRGLGGHHFHGVPFQRHADMIPIFQQGDCVGTTIRMIVQSQRIPGDAGVHGNESADSAADVQKPPGLQLLRSFPDGCAAGSKNFGQFPFCRQFIPGLIGVTA